MIYYAVFCPIDSGDGEWFMSLGLKRNDIILEFLNAFEGIAAQRNVPKLRPLEKKLWTHYKGLGYSVKKVKLRVVK